MQPDLERWQHSPAVQLARVERPNDLDPVHPQLGRGILPFAAGRAGARSGTLIQTRVG